MFSIAEIVEKEKRIVSRNERLIMNRNFKEIYKKGDVLS